MSDFIPAIVLPLCSNCMCQPVASAAVKCGFTDWCKRCDDSLFATQDYMDLCDRRHLPPPPVSPLKHNGEVCPCGFFAIRNRPLARPGKENMPLHLLVTVPITANSHITVCLICDQLFKHHRNGLAHLRRHHSHYHEHHPVSGKWNCRSMWKA
jgi:hypothetical protein